MQSTSKARNLVSISRFHRLLNLNRSVDTPHYAVRQWRSHSTFLLSRLSPSSPGISGYGDSLNHRPSSHFMPLPSVVGRASSYCSDATTSAESSSITENAKGVYDKMMVSVKGRTMPPNAWLWSLIAKCENSDDIKLLFDMLQALRAFRLSNLRIASDFNDNLCREITKACVRVGAPDFGKKALWKHNVYGLNPSIGCAHQLLLHAKEHNDITLMVDIMKLLKRNDLPLQPGTADIVFSICYSANDWKLMSKYSKKFMKAGIKFRQPSFDLWMEFAAKIGDTECLWKIEKLRSKIMKKHTLATGFACAKGFLLEHKPQDANKKKKKKPQDATNILLVLYQGLSDAKKPGIVAPLGKLVSEWPLEVIKHKKDDDRKELIASLKKDIPVMFSGLVNTGLDFDIDVEALNKQEPI